MLRDRRLGEWAHLTKRKIKHCKGSVILVNDERSATLSDKAERPEKKRESAPGFAVKRAVIKSWRVFFWSNQPQKGLTCFIIRYSEFRNIPSCRVVPIPGADDSKS